MIILAIETSCDETSVAIVSNNKILSNIVHSQILKHQPYGGVVPEIAAREHTANISSVLQAAITAACINYDDIDYIAYTAKPGLINCLLVGKTIAETISLFLNKPLLPVNHLQGHIYAGIINQEWQFPVLGLIVSGGHTQLVLLKEHLKMEVIGTTEDDAAGECFDKVARMLGLKYPGGPEISKYAKTGKKTYNLPLPKDDSSLNFSFSGLKSACANIIEKEINNLNINDFSASLETTIVDILIKKSILALEKTQPKTFILSGGVSANNNLRNHFLKLKEKYSHINFIVPELEYCTDNAAMIGILAYYMLIN